MSSTGLKAKVTYAREEIERVWEKELLPMMTQHFLEIGSKSETFKPTKELYVKMDQDDRAVLYTMRLDGVLVGYTIFLLLPHHHHYIPKTWALEDAIYAVPEMRGTRELLGFLEAQDRHLIGQLDVKRIMRTVRFEQGHRRTLERKGYRHLECHFLLEVD